MPAGRETGSESGKLFTLGYCLPANVKVYSGVFAEGRCDRECERPGSAE
jgi:hypothetical protein